MADMRTITLEEHFFTQSFLQATGQSGESSNPQMAELQPKLLDLGVGRIAAMDEAGIDLQILSLAALGVHQLDPGSATSVLRDVNDELAQAIRANPTRLAGFATLNLHNAPTAAKELERCVRELGFAGALIDGTTAGLFYDDPSFLPFWEAAAALKTPVYLHPAPPPEPVMKAYFSGLTPPLGPMLSIAGWGWHAETGLHTLRLIVSGLFDRFPDLQLAIGHMGEGLPYALARSSGILSGPAHLRQTVADYFRTNIHITTSGYFTEPPFACAREVVGLDRMMFSVDYPFSPNTKGRSYLDALAEVLTLEDMEALTHGNAEKLFRLSA